MLSYLENITSTDMKRSFFLTKGIYFSLEMILTSLSQVLDTYFIDIVGFKLSEYAYCAFDALEDITKGRRDYVLSNKKRTTCGINVNADELSNS